MSGTCAVAVAVAVVGVVAVVVAAVVVAVTVVVVAVVFHRFPSPPYHFSFSFILFSCLSYSLSRPSFKSSPSFVFVVF